MKPGSALPTLTAVRRRQEAHLLPDDLQRVMVLDATHSSHPIVQKVDTPDQITAIFDAISYAKVRTASGHRRTVGKSLVTTALVEL